MNRNKVMLAALLLVAIGCRAGGLGDGVFMQQFGPSIAFAPPGMTGWWFCGKNAMVNGEHLQTSATCIEMRCGKGFQLPKEFGAGRYDGVVVEDYGESGVPQGRVTGQFERMLVGGFAVWREFPQSDVAKQEWWCAVVDGRFVVMATSGSLLEASLRRSGRWSLELPGVMSHDMEFVECAILTTCDDGRIAPSLVAVLKKDPWRMQILNKSNYSTWMEESEGYVRRNTIVDGWHSTEFWKDKPDEEFFLGAQIILLTTFGMCVII